MQKQNQLFKCKKNFCRVYNKHPSTPKAWCHQFLRPAMLKIDTVTINAESRNNLQANQRKSTEVDKTSCERTWYETVNSS
ncbi:hypothetical protein C0J52_26773 [Blattella germanica]|nr:hypothetical protein C0J52_26773 [Blattella germanica]